MRRYWKSEEIEFLHANHEIMTAAEIGQALNRTASAIQNYVFRLGVQCVTQRSMDVYALYKGEEMLVMGSIDEIAEAMNVDRKTVFFYQSGAYKRRGGNGKSRRVLVKLEGDDE